jgi:polyhydroxybutyrate depolymerase
MVFKNSLLILAMWLGCTVSSMAAVNDRDWNVDGIQRTGIVCTPEPNAHQPSAGWPVVFVFHGHGGNARQIRRQFQTDTFWPDAIVVYLQGLPTVGQLTDPQGVRAGWDSVDTTDKNKDLRFYDLVLKDLIAHQHIDTKHVFSTGHSNGGGFTFTLWAHRGDTLAAIAASSSSGTRSDWPLLKPKPAMMSSGRNDPLVKFAWQSRMIEHLKSLNGVAANGKPWGRNGTWYASDTGTPVATIIYDGGHAPPMDLGQRVVEFFKTVSRSTPKP